jgi:ATP-dependent protease HslVU (ClpYQ) peptidase subunit
MTLVVCLKSKEGIVLAADSRGTIGDPRGLTAINDTQDKILSMGNCGFGLAGQSEIGAALLDELKANSVDHCGDIDQARIQVVRESSRLFSEWFRGIAPQQRPAVLITLAGYRKQAEQEPEPMIYLLNSQTNFAPQLF